ncbi:MAG: hypothetical protein ABSA48_01115 [Terracidiphilus sp.]|jgi:ribosomal protein S15P/S13E
MTDTLVLQKPDGRAFQGIRACVSSKGILIPDVRLPIEVGDKLTRNLPNGLTDTFIVDDPGFRETFSDIAAHFQVKVHKARPEKAISPVQSNALRLLRAIYEQTHDQTHPVDDVTKLKIGLTDEESRAAWRYLRDKGLIQTFNLEYAARINGRGVDAIENAQNHPNQPTSGFPLVTYNNVYNTINVGHMVSSSVQQAGAHADQNQTIAYSSQEDRSNLERLIVELTNHLNELNIDAYQKQKAEAQIATIKAQLTDDEPDPVIIKQAGRTLRNITEGAIGSLVATAVQPAVWHWISQAMAMLFPK